MLSGDETKILMCSIRGLQVLEASLCNGYASISMRTTDQISKHVNGALQGLQTSKTFTSINQMLQDFSVACPS